MRIRNRIGMARNLLLVIVAMGAAAAYSATPREIANVNGKSITDSDINVALSGFNEGQRKNLLKDPNSRNEIVERVIDQELLAQEAEKEKLDQSQDFKDALAAFRKQYLASKVLEKSLGDKITDKEVKKHYENNRRRYSTDQVHAMHILVATESEAQDLLKKVKEPNADFQAIAEKSSKDPSAKNNRGDLGFFTRDRMVAEFSDAAFNAKDGQIVGPIKTNYGYHIIKVVERKAGKTLEFDEVELRVKADLEQTLIKAYVSKLKDLAKIKIEKAELEKL